MLLKGKRVFVKQESLLWWHVLRCKLVIWPTAGSVLAVYPEMPPVVSAGERILQTGGFTECMWNSDLLHCILPALHMPEKALRMQSSAGWSHWTCYNMDTEVCWGCNHDIMKYLLVQQEHLILCLNLFMQEGVGQIYPCQSFASSWSLPRCPPSLRKLVCELSLSAHSTAGVTNPRGPLVCAFPVAPARLLPGEERQVGWRVMAPAMHTGGNEGGPVSHSKYSSLECHGHQGISACSGRDTQACTLARLETE